MNEDLKDSIARFKTNIIKPVDKSELKTYIDKLIIYIKIQLKEKKKDNINKAQEKT